MTIVILLVLVALLWVAVLAPSAWRKFSERQGVGSIDHFHHQLQLLEHAGPKTVAPAYRLHTALPAPAGSAVEAPSPAPDSSRPKLVLLRPTDDATAADVEDNEGLRYERVGVLDRPEPVCAPEVGADLRVLRRDEARRRFTMLLRCLVGVALSTGIIGLFPGMHLAWIFTALTGLGALALVGLMAYAREVEVQQREHRRARRGHALYPGDSVLRPADATFDPASAGYPGAWDDELDELPQAAVR
ncbi:MAG TPA: hypothetical protein VHS57_02425 [Acidimicrobiales bacterium]|nr:hypothetical protein [Acidimicrobiales bacterium]